MNAPDAEKPVEERRAQPRPDGGDFLELVKRKERGKLKLYIGSAAGVGKTYRMINEAHDLKRRDIDVVIGFVETHKREETEAQLRDIEVIPRQHVEYRGVTLARSSRRLQHWLPRLIPCRRLSLRRPTVDTTSTRCMASTSTAVQ